ncbi:hypothetical protein OUZ56_024530 [Daphnia magna]|uniref:Uncharacterized protein n=1 Tax=Daphnia magna TaxID=35525 RepID=A0ABR0B0V6_9CRUS|nr:hypothetical protein OUZ56_024530 [Daphnia magna]
MSVASVEPAPSGMASGSNYVLESTTRRTAWILRFASKTAPQTPTSEDSNQDRRRKTDNGRTSKSRGTDEVSYLFIGSSKKKPFPRRFRILQEGGNPTIRRKLPHPTRGDARDKGKVESLRREIEPPSCFRSTSSRQTNHPRSKVSLKHAGVKTTIGQENVFGSLKDANRPNQSGTPACANGYLHRHSEK